MLFWSYRGRPHLDTHRGHPALSGARDASDLLFSLISTLSTLQLHSLQSLLSSPEPCFCVQFPIRIVCLASRASDFVFSSTLRKPRLPRAATFDASSSTARRQRLITSSAQLDATPTFAFRRPIHISACHRSRRQAHRSSPPTALPQDPLSSCSCSSNWPDWTRPASIHTRLDLQIPSASRRLLLSHTAPSQ